MNVAVVGCGVSGLSCGIRLLESGCAVTILARDLPPHTTSNAAAAIWYPYLAYPEDRVLQWGRVTLDEFYRLMAVPGVGLSTVTLVELFDRTAPIPWWRDAVRSFSRTPAEALPPGYQDGYTVEIPLIETPIYMNYLVKRFLQSGGQIVQQAVAALSDLADGYPVIVNCTGVGARELAGDAEVYPIRGQIVRVKAPGITRSLMDEVSADAPVYIIPRSDGCILGGTSERDDWSLDINTETVEHILRKCQRVEPALAGAEIVDHAVGLRPGRKEVRLEVEMLSERCAVIHNYGHGGAGFTLSWGCANEVTALAAQFSSQTNGAIMDTK